MAISRWAVYAALICGLTGPALAAGDLELAKQYFHLGEKLYQRADYAGALKHFRLSHDNSKRPELLYNIARCYELLGKPREAVEYYQRYLKETKRDNKIVSARIENLRKRIKEPGAATKTEPGKTEPAKTDPAKTEPGKTEPGKTEPGKTEPGKTEPLKVGDAAREPPVDPIVPEESESGASKRPLLRIIGWSFVGTGAALLVTGAILGGVAAGKASDIEDAAAQGEYWDQSASTFSDGESMESAQTVLLIAGGVVAVAGAVMVIYDLMADGGQEKPDASAQLFPLVGENVVGLGGSWRF